MALNPPDRSGDRTPFTHGSDKPVDWQSPWPVGHPNRTEYVSPEQQTKNMQPKKQTEYYTDYDKKSGNIMKKSDIQARDGWVSPWPQGHPNYTENANG